MAFNTEPASKGTNKNLPAIICLHGRGSNSTIFTIQARKIIHAFKSTHNLIFVDAPFESDAGPGILPVFESVTPFWTWVRSETRVGEGSETLAIVTPQDREVIEAKLDQEVIEYGGWGNVVGIMGFSQGARMAIGFVLRQLVLLQNQQKSKTSFRFGVFLGAPFPPFALEDVEVIGRGREYIKNFPTVHAWGDEDPFKNLIVQMLGLCEGESCLELEFEGGHHLPLVDVEADNLVAMIRLVAKVDRNVDGGRTTLKAMRGESRAL